jgi:hypothetical protein
MKNENINRNADGSYMDANEIVRDILHNRLEEDSKNLLKNKFIEQDPEMLEMSKETGLDTGVFAKMEFGRWIRNSYGLWNEDNPYTMVKWTEYGQTPDSMFHPDNFSHEIIERLIYNFGT